MRGKSVDRKCAEEQDDAVQFAVLAFVVADAQQKMPDKKRWV
jgi:hypothetical protein